MTVVNVRPETVGRGQKVIQTGNLRAKRIIITKNPSVSISLRLVCGQDDSWCRYSRPSVASPFLYRFASDRFAT